MNIRREPTYLSTEVWRALWLLSKSGESEVKKITPDEIADSMLRDAIMDHYPQLFEHQKQVAQLEKELLKTL